MLSDSRSAAISKVACALVALLGIAVAIGHASGPFALEARFWEVGRPSAPYEDFLAGQLGVVSPDLSALDLFVAYRHLNGLEIQEPARQAILQARTPLPRNAPLPPSPVHEWQIARRVHGRVDTPIRSWQVYRRHELSMSGQRTLQRTYKNCLPDAFAVAAATLEERARHYGSGAPQIERWIDAQDQVFSNCEGPGTVPLPPEAGWDSLAKADRSYQIAAAHFYSERLETARDLFESMASDGRSPWRHLADHIVARTWIRESSFLPDGRITKEGPEYDAWISALENARQRLEAILANPERASVHPGSARLLHYVLGRLEPDAERQRLVDRLSAPTLTETTPDDLANLYWLGGSGEVGSWINAMRMPRGHSEARRVLEAFDPGRTDGWLLAHLRHSLPTDARFEDILAAAAVTPQSSPAYASLQFERALSLWEADRADEARALLDDFLGDSPPVLLSLGDRNRFQHLRALYAASLDELAELAPMEPIAVGYTDGSRGALFSEDRVDSQFVGELLIEPVVLHQMSRYLSPDQILDVASHSTMTPRLEAHLARIAWTRSVLFDEPDTPQLSQRVAALDPALADDILSISRDSLNSDFATWLTVLRNPGLTPFFRPLWRLEPVDERSKVSENWWCGGEQLNNSWMGGVPISAEPPAPSFLEAAALDRADERWQALTELQDAANAFGEQVLEWTDANPADPRSPEALHLLVRLTRFGCRPPDLGELSKAAFTRLHTRYPESSWTLETPYWHR